MSLESTRNSSDLVANPAAREIAASVAKHVAGRAAVDVRYLRASARAARPVPRSSAASAGRRAHPYSSFEQGGVRRFERAPPPFTGTAAGLARFRIS